MTAITPDEFALEMRSLIAVYVGDDEALMLHARELMEETLRSLGYGYGLSLLQNMIARLALSGDGIKGYVA